MCRSGSHWAILTLSEIGAMQGITSPACGSCCSSKGRLTMSLAVVSTPLSGVTLLADCRKGLSGSPSSLAGQVVAECTEGSSIESPQALLPLMDPCMSEPSPPDMCRRFVEMAFERVGMSIWWEGSRGLGDNGIINTGSHVGKTVVTICSDFFRPIEVMPLGLDCRGGFGAHYPNAKGNICGAKNLLSCPSCFVGNYALVAPFSMQPRVCRARWWLTTPRHAPSWAGSAPHP